MAVSFDPQGEFWMKSYQISEMFCSDHDKEFKWPHSTAPSQMVLVDHYTCVATCDTRQEYKKSLTGLAWIKVLSQLIYAKKKGLRNEYQKILNCIHKIQFHSNITLSFCSRGFFLKAVCAVCNSFQKCPHSLRHQKREKKVAWVEDVRSYDNVLLSEFVSIIESQNIFSATMRHPDFKFCTKKECMYAGFLDFVETNNPSSIYKWPSIADFDPCMNLATRRFCCPCWLRVINKLIDVKFKKQYEVYSSILSYIENMTTSAQILLKCSLEGVIRICVCEKCGSEKCKQNWRKNKILIGRFRKNLKNVTMSKLVYLIKENYIERMILPESYFIHNDKELEKCDYVDFVKFIKNKI